MALNPKFQIFQTSLLVLSILSASIAATVDFSIDETDGTGILSIAGLGKVRGTIRRNSVQFLGIRYAHPPVGNLRWRAPKLYEEPWDGIINATATRIACPQLHPSYAHPDIITQEDCLFLNVWMPLPRATPSNDTGYPVVVFIHGGTFIADSASAPYIDGEMYNNENVILVAINYRIGLLGFMAHPELTKQQPTDPTNFGLLDQRAALQWVAKYIPSFGGDPNRVTLLGQSAGAISIAAHLTALTGTDKRLYHRAALLSMPPWYPFVSLQEAEAKGKLFAEMLGCSNPTNTTEEIECLRRQDPESFIERGPRFLFFHAFKGTITGPVIDNVNFRDPSLTSFQEGLFDAEIPLIIGTTKHEGRLFVHINFIVMPPSPAYYEELINASFSHYHDAGANRHLVQDVLNLYNLSEKYQNSTFEALSDILSDTAFTCPNKELLAAVANHQLRSTGNRHAWGYVFSYASPNTTIQFLGAFHGCELAYAFAHAPGIFWTEVYRPEEYDMAVTFVRYLVAFAKNGKPSYEGQPVEWPTYIDSDSERSILSFSPNISIVSNYRSEQCEFWTSRFPKGIPHISVDVLENEPFLSVFANDYFVASVNYYQQHRLQVVLSAALLVTSLFALILLKGLLSNGNKSRTSIPKQKDE